MKRKFIKLLVALKRKVKSNAEKNSYKPKFRVTEIFEKNDEHHVAIKAINKNITYTTKPEEILANDYLVDQFSPRDIRTLTYLGYLGMNAPKFKILAKKLSQSAQAIFLLKEKGGEKIITKTANQIINEEKIISHMSSEDAKSVGYTIAHEDLANEKKQTEILLKTHREEKKNRD